MASSAPSQRPGPGAPGVRRLLSGRRTGVCGLLLHHIVRAQPGGRSASRGSPGGSRTRPGFFLQGPTKSCEWRPQHPASGQDLVRRAFDAFYRAGELAFAGYCFTTSFALSLAVGAPLAEVQAEAERGLAFSCKAQLSLVNGVLSTQPAARTWCAGRSTPSIGPANWRLRVTASPHRSRSAWRSERLSRKSRRKPNAAWLFPARPN